MNSLSKQLRLLSTGRTLGNCPVFGCGSINLARLANHLDQIHDMDTGGGDATEMVKVE